MPLPLILGIAAGIVGTTGVGLGIHGGVKMKQANDKLTKAQKRDASNNARLKRMNRSACKAMDVLGKNEMKILCEFQLFSNLFERIKNRPEFGDIKIGNVKIPKFEGEEIKKASVGASVLIGGLGGAALGTAGGFAASGATTAAVMALGTASTGTAISALSGAAATNATLAALGGGSLAAGGGGIALGTTILGATTLGVGLLVGGVIFSCTGSKLSSKADKAWGQMISNEQKINKICNYLFDLQRTAERYNATLLRMCSLYRKQLDKMRNIIESFYEKHICWQNLSLEEQLVIENMVLIVGVLYNMCKVQLVQKSCCSNQNIINKTGINKVEKDANNVILQMNDEKSEVLSKGDNTYLAFSAQNNNVKVEKEELGINQIVFACESYVYKRSRYPGGEKEECGNIDWDKLMSLMKDSYEIDCGAEEYSIFIDNFGSKTSVWLHDLRSGLKNFVYTYQVSYIVSLYLNKVHNDTLKESDIDWTSLLQTLQNVYGVKVEKWQLFVPGKNTIETVVENVCNVIKGNTPKWADNYFTISKFLQKLE